MIDVERLIADLTQSERALLTFARQRRAHFSSLSMIIHDLPSARTLIEKGLLREAPYPLDPKTPPYGLTEAGAQIAKALVELRKAEEALMGEDDYHGVGGCPPCNC